MWSRPALTVATQSSNSFSRQKDLCRRATRRQRSTRSINQKIKRLSRTRRAIKRNPTVTRGRPLFRAPHITSTKLCRAAARESRCSSPRPSPTTKSISTRRKPNFASSPSCSSSKTAIPVRVHTSFRQPQGRIKLQLQRLEVNLSLRYRMERRKGPCRLPSPRKDLSKMIYQPIWQSQACFACRETISRRSQSRALLRDRT